MSKPTKLSEIRIGDAAPSAAPLPALVQGTGRSPNLTGAVGALVTGGPSVGAVQLKSTTVTAATLTADQLVGGQIGFAAGGGAADIALPSVEDLFQFLTRDWFQAASSPTSDVGATTALTLPSVPVQYFDCTFTTGAGSTPSLVFGDLEFYPDGPANAVSGLTKLTLFASSVATYRFFPIQYSSVVAPRIGFYVQSQATSGGGGGSTWATVLAAGNDSGGTNPIITAGDQVIFESGISIGGNNTVTGAVHAQGVALGEGAIASGSGAVTIGAASSATGSNAVALGYGSFASGNEGFAAHGATAAGANSIAVGGNTVASAAITLAAGLAANATASGAIALGSGAIADGVGSIALGNGADNNGFASSVAIGEGASNTAANEIQLGTALENVSIPGNLWLGTKAYSAGTAPTAAASGPGNLTSVSVGAVSTDVAGLITGVATGGGAWQATVTYNSAYGGVGNIVVLGPTLDNSFHAHLITINGGSSTTFVVNGISPGAAAPWSVAYHVIGLR